MTKETKMSTEETEGTPRIRAAWATATEQLDVGFPQPLSSADVVDRLLILDLVNHYGWTYDERRIDVMRAIFTADGVFEGSFWGEQSAPPSNGIEAIIEWQEYWMGQQTDQRRHLLSNVIVKEQTAERAVVLANMAITSSEGTTAALAATGFYRFTLRKEESQWRIERLFAGFDGPF
ncbi:MAG TPA: nuclear transport factor 2 family protein [Pseudolysinimonas sp.]|nr:nuclear transport factor 2 family protein [Pseudolysinimonas sp.]